MEVRRRGKWSVVGWLLVVAALVVGSAAAGVQAQGEPILIGAALSLTGIQAPLDTPGLLGAQLAVKTLNERGGILGREVRLVNLDSKSDPVTTGTVAQQLINLGAKAILAPCDFDFGSPASREAQAAGLVGISLCASSPLYGSHTLGDKQFTLSMWNTTMGAAAADYAYNERGWRTAYVVTDTFIDYTASLSRYFIQAFEHFGGRILGEDKYTQGAQDFSAQLTRLRNLRERPDVLFISSYMPDLGTIIRSIREVGIDAPVVGGDSYDDPALFEALGERFGSEVYFVTHSWVGPEAHPRMGEFLELYRAEYGEDPDTAFVTTGWDAVMVLAQAMERAGTTDGAAVAKAMEEIDFDLLTGRLRWKPAAEWHEPVKAGAIIQLQQGKPSFVGWKEPSFVPRP